MKLEAPPLADYFAKVDGAKFFLVSKTFYMVYKDNLDAISSKSKVVANEVIWALERNMIFEWFQWCRRWRTTS